MTNPLQTLTQNAPSNNNISQKPQKELPIPKTLINDTAIRERVHAPNGTLRFLGRGQYAGVYDLGDGRVLKLTRDKKDALAFANVLHRPAPAFAITLDVFQIPGKKIYGIVSEKLKPLSSVEEFEWNVFSNLYFYRLSMPLALQPRGINSTWAKFVLKSLDIWGNHIVQVGWAQQDPGYWPFDEQLWNAHYNPEVEQVIKSANIIADNSKQKFLVKVAKSLEHARITWWDLHGGNIMRRAGAKRIVIADLGLSNAPRVKIPVLGKSQGPRVFDVAASSKKQETLYKNASSRIKELRTASIANPISISVQYEGQRQEDTRNLEVTAQDTLDNGDRLNRAILEASNAIQDEVGQALSDTLSQVLAEDKTESTSPDVIFKNAHIEVIANENELDDVLYSNQATEEIFSSDSFVVLD